MQNLDIDIEKSREIYNQLKGELHMKGCYENTWKIVNHFRQQAESEWYIGFGFVKVDKNLYTRHAFLIDRKTNRVIDATVCITEREEKGIDYYPFAILTMDEYIDQLLKSTKHNPDLMGAFRKEQEDLRKEMATIGLIGHY